MSVWILLIVIYAIAGICIYITRKIHHDNTEYFTFVALVVGVCILYTVFVIVYGLMV